MIRRKKIQTLRRQRIPLPGHEHELVPLEGPAIWDIQGERAVIELRRKKQYPQNRYPLHDPIGNPELPGETHLAKS